MMVLVLEDDFEFILVTFHWWQTTSLKIVPIKIFCPYSCIDRSSLEVRVQLLRSGVSVGNVFSASTSTAFENILVLAWGCSCEHFPGCTRTLGCSVMPFPLSLNIWKSSLLGFKDLLCVLLGFPRHASLRDRSPESSEPYVTLVPESALIRTTFGVHNSFFPGSHLRVSRTLLTFRLLEEFCLTSTLCRETRQRVLAFTFKGN